MADIRLAFKFFSGILTNLDVAALVRSHMNGFATLWEYNRTSNRNHAPSPKTITDSTMIKQKQLTTAATLLEQKHVISYLDTHFPKLLETSDRNNRKKQIVSSTRALR